MKPSSILRAALEWFGPNGERWCKDEYFLNQLHINCCAYQAAYACSKGALIIAGDQSRDASTALSRIVGYIPFWNDSAKDFSEIREGFQKAIHLAESEGR